MDRIPGFGESKFELQSKNPVDRGSNPRVLIKIIKDNLINYL